MSEAEIPPFRAERRDAAENRQRILNAAIRLFEQYGVEQVSMNQIATEAQLGPGTLYRRYRNKSELCLDLIKDHVDLLFEDMEAYLELNRTEATSLRLKGILRIFLAFREKKLQLLNGVEESLSPNRSKTRTHGPIYHELHKLLVGLYEEMTASGVDRRPPDSVFRADMLLAALSSDSYLFQRDTRGYSPEAMLEQLYRTFVDRG
ncbi:TetR/AcrR family transcriptional regulator [Paenibacillus aurantius]|uniref:TetR/AcrR family transcriptional regulator n=1 Tax=Paenibacillus aurantius TaxID=2918900 RepID=A0AA96REK7_9BACL|nr:TetR/AcrR family transcriptional regulator [Paenibacillus aurantius]WNQ10992.1 TetR/AcrR family transcriptional regulator [Paenibacillus aurantius]